MNNTLPTPEEFRNIYAKKIGDISWDVFMLYLKAIGSHNSTKYTNSCMHEYGVLMARHYVQDAIKQIQAEVKDDCKSMHLVGSEVDSISDTILTAFDINTIK